MKSIKRILFACAVAGMMAGCANTVERAEKTVDDFFTAIKNNDFSKVVKLVDDDDGREYERLGAEEERKQRLKSFEYKIISSEKVDDDTVYVDVEITSPESLKVTVEVEEDDGSWRIDSDSNLLKAVFGELEGERTEPSAT